MGDETVVQAAGMFNPRMGSKQERAAQVLVINDTMSTFIKAAIDVTDALSFDFDLEDDDPCPEHEGAGKQYRICGHGRNNQSDTPQNVLSPAFNKNTML